MAWWCVSWALLVGALGSAEALAQDPASAPVPASEDASGPSVSFNDDFELRYWTSEDRLPDPPDVPVFDYIEQVNRLNANVTAGKWTFAAQVDEVTLWSDRYFLDDVEVLEKDLTFDGLPNVFPGRFADTAYLNLEKIRGTVEGEWGSVSLGDSYVAFGRGIALNMNRNVDIDIDTSVQGGKAVLRPGAWDITLVAGQANKQQVAQDNPNIEIRGDVRHLVAGVRAERFGLGPANLGAHGVVYDFVEDPGWKASVEQLDPFDAVVGGLTAEVIGIGGIDAYVEGDLFAYGPDQPAVTGLEDQDLGYGLYASTSAYPGPFVVLLEGKRYFQAERLNKVVAPELYEVGTAPSLEYERAITPDSSETLNSNDIWGVRLQIDWAAVPGKLVPFVAGAVFRDVDLELHVNPVPETIVHPMAGVEWIDGEIGLLVNAGYRSDDRDGTEFGADHQAHGDLSFNFPLPSELVGSVSAQVERFESTEKEYFEAETGYTLGYGSAVAATFFVDVSNDPLALSERPGNLSETVFGSAELQIKPSSEWTLKALYGSQKAGIRCSGGQCRQLPGFEGARLSVVGTF